MKKIIFTLVVILTTALGASAQNQANYAGSSKFTDNWSVSVQGGVVTPFTSYFKDGAITPIVVLDIDKYITPWLGVGVDGRTAIGVGDDYNTHTTFDAVNVSGLVKFNLANLINYSGERKTFEPVVYTGLGWGHNTCSAFEDNPLGLHTSANRNYMTYRAGLELNLNLGKNKNVGIVVNPSVVWGGICNGMLNKKTANFEVTAGLVYHLKTSNGSNSMKKAVLYNYEEVDRLEMYKKELENKNADLSKKLREPKPQVTKTVEVVKENTFAVSFDKNSSKLSNEAKAVLDKVPNNSTVSVAGTASPEGLAKRNEVLAQERADAVKEYLESRGVTVKRAAGGESGRLAIVTIQ